MTFQAEQEIREYIVEDRVPKILEDLLLVESRVIRENATLGLDPELDNEGKGPTELKLQREIRDLEERIR
ncbi:hypothetical protein ACLOJK_007461 [Asimina triloba]